jgi:hypothetical protein
MSGEIYCWPTGHARYKPAAWEFFGGMSVLVKRLLDVSRDNQ